MKRALTWFAVVGLCAVVGAGVLSAKKGPAGNVGRDDMLQQMQTPDKNSDAALAAASLKLAHAERLIARGDRDLAIDVLGRIDRMQLPDTREARKIFAHSNYLLGELYRTSPEGPAAKGMHFYDRSVQFLDPATDADVMIRVVRSASDLLTSLGGDAGQLEMLARDLEAGNVPSSVRLVKDSPAAQLEDAGDDTCDASVGVTLDHSEIMSISPAGDHNWRDFSVSGPTVVRIETISTDTFGDDTDLTLYGGCDAGTPTDFIEFDDDDGPGFLSLIELCVPAGTYYVEVGGFNDTATPDDFELAISDRGACVIPAPDSYEVDDELSQANSIGFRNNGVGEGNQFGRDNKQIQSHSIFPALDIDFVKFDLSRANVVRIETSGEDNPDTIIGLTNSGGLLMAVNDDKGGGSLGSRLDICLPQGTWYVPMIAFSASGTFDYEVAVDVEVPCDFEDEPNGICGQANPISLGDTISGLQLPGGVIDNDYFSFELTAEAQVTIETSGYDDFDVDTFLDLYDGCPGNLLASDDDAGPGFLSKISMLLPAGTYYVNSSVSPFSVGASFPYTLTLTASQPPIPEDEPNDSCAQANAASLGDNYGASISPAGDRDHFLLTVPADGFVEIETNGPSGDTVLQIESADGSVVIGCDDDAGDGLFSKWSCCLPAGDYCVAVRDFGDNSTISSYTVEFRDLGVCTPTDPPSCPVDGLGCPF